MASIHDIAKCILDIKGNISSYELQMLCFYCQAWSLALGEGRMYPERFEAWRHIDPYVVRYSKHMSTSSV